MHRWKSDAITHPACDITNEGFGGRGIALAATEDRNNLGLGINRAKRPNIAVLRIVAHANMASFLPTNPHISSNSR